VQSTKCLLGGSKYTAQCNAAEAATSSWVRAMQGSTGQVWAHQRRAYTDEVSSTMMDTISRPSSPAFSRLARSTCAGSPLPCSMRPDMLTQALVLMPALSHFVEPDAALEL
jgi:hypothetical protein